MGRASASPEQLHSTVVGALTFTPRASVSVVTIPGKGRGVVAVRRIVRGELIDEAPIVAVPKEQRALLEQTVLDHYVYEWADGGLAVVLGNGSLYNHSYEPNARYEKDFEAKVIRYVAHADIEAGDEVLINYNGEPDNDYPMWFDVR